MSDTVSYPKDLDLIMISEIYKNFSSIPYGNKNDKQKRIELFCECFNSNELFRKFISFIYNQPYQTHCTINVGTRRPAFFRESKRSETITEDEYVYNIFELFDKLNNEDVSEIDRYLLFKRYISANYDNLDTIYKLIEKRRLGQIKCEDVNSILKTQMPVFNIKQRYNITDTIDRIDFKNYFLIKNPGKGNGAMHAFFIFNKYGEIIALNSSGDLQRGLWGPMNDLMNSFKNNRLKNIVIEGTFYFSDDNGNEIDFKYSGRGNKSKATQYGVPKFCMYDIYSYDEFVKGKSGKNYLERYSELKKIYEDAVNPTERFYVADCEIIKDNEWLYDKLFSDYDHDGYLIISPNKMDYEKVQEVFARKIVKRVHCINSARIKDGKLNLQKSNVIFWDVCRWLSDDVRDAILKNTSILINKDIDIIAYNIVRGNETSKNYTNYELCKIVSIKDIENNQ